MRLRQIKWKTGVALPAVYSDEKSSALDPDCHGGDEGGSADESGVWKATCVVNRRTGFTLGSFGITDALRRCN